jgi:hypothetical protein
LLKGSKGDIDADRGVLESDQREIEARCLAKVELERDQEAHAIAGCGGDEVRGVIGFTATNELVKRLALRGGGSDLCPYFHPFTGLAINLLLSHFKGDFLDEGVTYRVGIRQEVTRCVSKGWEIDFQCDTAEEIAAARDQARDALAKVGRTVEIHRHVFGGEGGMTAIDHSKEADLWVTR